MGAWDNKELVDKNRGSVVSTITEALNVLKDVMPKGIRLSSMISALTDGTWRVTVSGNKEETAGKAKTLAGFTSTHVALKTVPSQTTISIDMLIT